MKVRVTAFRLFAEAINFFLPGIPSQDWGQSYYTLRSIYLSGVPPPRIHIHLRLFDVHNDLPLGDVSEPASKADAKSQLSRSQRVKDMEISPEDAAVFDKWLRTRWREKDVLLDRYHATGTFENQSGTDVRQTETPAGVEKIFLSGSTSRTYELPLVLRSKLDISTAFTHFVSIIIPVSLWMLWNRLV